MAAITPERVKDSRWGSRRRNLRRRISLVIIAFIAALALTAVVATPASAAPASGNSYYVTGYSTSWAYSVGCTLGTADKNLAGTQRHVVVLDFGAMYLSSSSVWMVTAFQGADFSLASARVMVQEFAHGYWVCTGSDTTSTAYVGLGTNNSWGTITASAGAALAVQANTAWNTIQNNGWIQGFAIGANDFESWNQSSSSATAARAWIDGYNGVSSKPFFVNYGSADGCPTAAMPSAGSCNVGLPAETIWRVSWSGVAYPLPEIYVTTGAWAKQWRYLSLYSYVNHGGRFSFQGVMTQSGACAQVGGCPGADNSPSTGWSQLNTQVNADSRTATTPGAPTDIRWK